MAYLDLAERFATAQQQALAAAEPVLAGGFTQREWAVIRLARDERLSSLREESDFVEFLRLLFGVQRKRPLANPRLEALRRVAVLSWHYRHNIAASELNAFFKAGFSTDHYEALTGHIGRERAASARRSRR